MISVFKKFKSWQIDLAVVILGSLGMTAWTLFRFFTKTVNFDMTGQPLLARQWLQGFADGSVTAPTNYVVKMLFIYMPQELLKIDPHVALITTVIVLNIITFTALYLLLKKLLQYFKVPVTGAFYLSMLWIATIAGSVFWIQFANSRNIELAAGVFVLYLALLFYRAPSKKLAVGLGVAGGVTFFADPLMQYTVPAIALAFVCIDSLRTKQKLKKLAWLTLLFAAAIGLALLLVAAVRQVTHVEFFGVSSLQQSLSVVQQPQIAAVQTAQNTVRLVAGTNEMGAWRQVVNITMIAVLGLMVVLLAIKKRVPPGPILFVVIWITAVEAIYIASGQPMAQTDNSRYLIMLAPALVFLFAMLGYSKKALPYARGALLVIVAINAVSLMWFTAKNWTHALPADAILSQRMQYLQTHNYAYGYASMDTAIAGGYLFGRDKPVLLPLTCINGQLQRSYLFFDRRVFSQNQAKNAASVPIILDGTTITSLPYVCSRAAIIAQFGPPLRQESLPSGDVVLIYKKLP